MIVLPKENPKHSLPIQIRFEDIDLAQHVNNGVYQSYFDLAKSRYFNQMFDGCIDWKKTGLVLAHIEIDYYQPTYIHEEIVVDSYVTKIGSKSFELVQVVRLADAQDEKAIKCVSMSVMVAFNYQEAYSFVLPEAWTKQLQKELVKI